MSELVIGIIGHRDLCPNDEETIQGALRSWAEKQFVRKEFENKSVTLLTSLASGADQLAAGVLKGTWPDQSKIDISPVVPFDEEAYREEIVKATQITSPWTQETLSIALARKRPRDWQPGSKEKNKEACYRDAGRYIAKKADILIVLWDGAYTGKVGGTSDTLHYALSPECQEERSKVKRRPLEIQWLAIPRASNPYPANEAFIWEQLYVPRSSHHSRFRTLFRGRANLWFGLTVTVGIISVLCSWLGNLPPRAKFGISMDMLLIAISHLVLNGLDTAADGATVLRTGRGLAVVFFAITLGAVANSLFHLWDRFALWRAASQRHYLICGLGWRGRQLLLNAADKRRTTKGEKFHAIAIERTPTEETKEFCSLVGARLIAGDASQPETLRKAGIEKIEDAFVVGGDDQTNMRIVQQLARQRANAALDAGSRVSNESNDLPSGPRDKLMKCCVALTSQRHFEVLKEVLPKESNIDLRIFNAESVTARMFLKSHHLDRFQASHDTEGAEVILVGKSAMADAILREVLQQGIFEKGKDLKVTCLSVDPERVCRAFTLEYPIFRVAKGRPPWTAEPEQPWENEKVLPSIRFLDLPRSEKGLLELCEENLLGAGEKRVTSVIVALDQPAKSASTTRLLSAYLKGVREKAEKDITLACYYKTPEDIYRYDIEHALNSGSGSLPVHVFSDFMGDCSMEVVLGAQMDSLARHVNGIYDLGSRIKRGEPIPDEPFEKYCNRIWRDLTENDKNSNRQQAAHELVQQRIRRRLGLDAVVRSEETARIEHRRWCAEYLLRGFRPLTRIPSHHSNRLYRWLRRRLFTLKTDERQQRDQWYNKAKAKPRFKECKKHATLIPLDDFDLVLGEKNANDEKVKDVTLTADLDKFLHENITCIEALKLVQQTEKEAKR